MSPRFTRPISRERLRSGSSSPSRLPRFFCCLVPLLLFCAGTVEAQDQGSVVEPAANFTIEVNGAPFYPLGWKMLGACSSESDTFRWGVLKADMEELRRHGANVVFETSTATGRMLPKRAGRGWSNWMSYSYEALDGSTRQRGHVRPGAYVAALRRYMDLAYGDGHRPIYTIVSLDHLAVPEGRSSPVDGGDSLRCERYARLIEDERAQHAAADSDMAALMPLVRCDGPQTLPFWEWNVRYVVRSLRDHPGLLAWYLWDEPAGVAWQHLFGIIEPDAPVPAYTGPASLPTPDLLRHTYHRVIDFETEGVAPDYRRHPIIVDLYDPAAFFSNRFSWSKEGALNPRFDSGPFDRTPEGGYHTPADILGLEASGTLVLTAARGEQPAHDWYWEPNFLNRKARMLREVTERDSLWSALFLAAQGQLSSLPPYGLAEPLRCPNPRPRLRLLNDRDLVWHFLSPQIDGLRGHVFYARIFTPDAGPGLDQRQRSDRLLEQFRAASLDRVFLTPPVTEGWTLGPITVEALTHYFRKDPNFVGEADDYAAGRSALLERVYLPDASMYRAGNFGRSSAPQSYGHATAAPRGTTFFEDYRLLQAALHRYEGALYLFLSNSYDAQISTSVLLESNLDGQSPFVEGRFDLDHDGRFAWRPVSDRARITREADGSVRLDIRFEPYEVRIFRIGS